MLKSAWEERMRTATTVPSKETCNWVLTGGKVDSGLKSKTTDLPWTKLNIWIDSKVAIVRLYHMTPGT